LASLYGTGSPVGYTFGPNFVSGSSLGSLGNPSVSYEAQRQGNIGIDINFYKSKFNITADYYEKSTKGLLFQPFLPGTLGYISAPSANIGSTKVTGVDMTFGYNSGIGKDLSVSTAVNFTTAKSLVTATNEEGTAKIFGGGYFNGQSQTVTVFEKDKAPAYYYGFKTDGLFQDVKQIAGSAKQTGAVPGDIKFVDINGDGVIDANDKTEIGNPTPDFTMGWNVNVGYKNFDFNVYTYASVGNEIYRAYDRNANYTNKFQDILDRWTGPGTTNDAKNPRYSFTDPNNNSRVSDRYVEDGSFIKIKNIMLGYTLQVPSVKKVFKALRVYAQVKNAFTFTNYTGFDPELSSGGLLDLGIDRGNFPQARTYAVGIDIKF
jgi:TonB-dependent starch-binding outer membrane protein SusC